MTNPHLTEAQARVGMVARKWTLDDLIDVGGMAAVYRATHRNGNRVAVKVLHRRYAEMAEAKERFLREGYAANKVAHPSAVTVLDDDELADGTPFIVMELLEGQALEERLQRERILSPSETFYVADHVLSVLAAAHEAGIIHRDIKPANVFLCANGVVKVLDFGLARVLEGPAGSGLSLTRTGTVIGTASYMSPEQARGKREAIDHRTDIYAVGAVMFRCLAGKLVHWADNPMDRLLLVMTEHAPRLGEVVPDIPADIARLVDRALAFQKADRYPDAPSMQQELRAIYQHHTGRPIDSGEHVSQMAVWATPGQERQGPSGMDDVHVEVVVEEPETGDSIFVELSEMDGGKAARYQLRRKPTPPPMTAVSEHDVLPEVSVVIDDDS